MKVRGWYHEDGTPVFQAGDTGSPYEYVEGDGDSTAIAFTKAVNDIIEMGEEVEGDAALKVAEVIKEAGAVMWSEEGGYEDLRQDVQAALPNQGSGPYEVGGYYVKDIALDARHALICGYTGDGPEHYVVPFDMVNGEPVLGDKSQWVEVEEQFVAKAGRMFSARNLAAMQEAHESLGKLIAAAVPQTEADAEEAGEEAMKAAGDGMTYSITKSEGSMRYTMGPLYAPMRKDAHGEWVEADELHKSLHDFVRSSADSGRRLNLQHGEKGDITCGEWVEAMAWPYEHEAIFKNAKGEEHTVKMPAGTVYLGVVWDEDYWDVEKCAPKGIDGYSLGGRAVKVRDGDDAPELEAMGYKVTKSSGGEGQ